MISDIPAAPWRDAKIHGIDIGRNFIWIDDDPDPYSVRRLAAKGLSGRLLWLPPVKQEVFDPVG